MSGRHLQELQNHAHGLKASVCMPRRREFRAFRSGARAHRSARLAGVSECLRAISALSPGVPRVGCRTRGWSGKKWRVMPARLPRLARSETRCGALRSRELLEKHLRRKGIINFLTRVCATFATSRSRFHGYEKAQDGAQVAPSQPVKGRALGVADAQSRASREARAQDRSQDCSQARSPCAQGAARRAPLDEAPVRAPVAALRIARRRC
jgi:hypothetical protein